jgi:hypothetical protein
VKVITEPSAVAPDARGNSVAKGLSTSREAPDIIHQAPSRSDVTLASGATARGSVTHSFFSQTGPLPK